MSIKLGNTDDSCHADTPLMAVTCSTYYRDILEALEQGNEAQLRSAISHTSGTTSPYVNQSFTHSADGVFSISSFELPAQIFEDLSQQDVVTIYPIHYAAMKGLKGCLKILLEAGADPNVKDSFGQTPLHILPKGNWRYDQGFQECLDALLDHPSTVTERLDLSKSTPLHRAQQCNWEYMVNKLKGDGANNKVTQKQKMSTDSLLKSVLDKNLRLFQNILADIETSGFDKGAILDENHGSYTLLQLACRCGSYEFVNEMLRNNASCVKRYDDNIFSPVMWATKCGYDKILRRLVMSMTKENLRDGALAEITEMGETPLHLSVMCANPQDSDGVNYHHCLHILLENKQYIELDKGNRDGNTALHFAALCDNIRSFSTLLREGADSTIMNVFGSCAMQYINKEGMIQVLNDCIEFDEKNKLLDQNNWIKVNYEMMNTSSNNENYGHKEMTFLYLISKIFQDKDILEHPLINIFVFLKWEKTKKFFYLNFVLHIFFVALLLTYIGIFHNSLEKPSDEKNIQNNDALRMSLAGFLLLILILRQVLQLIMMKYSREHMSKAKTVLEITTSALTVLLLCMPFNAYVKMTIAAWLVIFSLLELVLHLGQLPQWAVYITMFRAVAWNFTKFICLFSIVIAAFGFSFYLMFQVNEDFKTFPKSLLKTVIMAIGEVGYDELPVASFPVAASLLMAFFVFLIMLVIVNLLNGLAISDIQAIQHKAEVISRMSHVERLVQLEKAFMVESRCNPFSNIFNRLFQHTLILKNCLPDGHLTVYLSQNDSQFKYKTSRLCPISSSICECHGYKLNASHVKALRQVVMEKKRVTLQR